MMLTEEKVAEGFKAAGERMNTLEMSQKELHESINTLMKMLRSQRQAMSTGYFSGEPYNRVWATEEDAREFGEIVLQALGRKAMEEGTQIGGGVLVPSELSDQIIQRLGIFAKFRRNATVFPLGGGRTMVPRIVSDITVECPGEGQEIGASDVTFSQIEMIAKTWAALTAVSNELDEDSIIAVGAIVALSMIRSLAKKEDEVGFVGDGTEQYFGMTGIAQALLNVDPVIANIVGLIVATGNQYSEITLGDFRKVVGVLPEDCDEIAKWYMHKRFYYDVVYPLAEAAGVANIFEILSDRQGRHLLGYPVEFVHCMPYEEANSQICAILGDLQMGAYLGERRALSIERSEHVYFTKNQTGVRGIERIDINAFGVGDTTEPGPMVALITAPS